MTRFPAYRPSTALRQAIEALHRARRDRAAMQQPGQLDLGDPSATGGFETAATGREGTGTGEGLGQADTDALTSGRDGDE